MQDSENAEGFLGEGFLGKFFGVSYSSTQDCTVLQSGKLRQLRWRLGTLNPSRGCLHSAGVLMGLEAMGRISSGQGGLGEQVSTGRPWGSSRSTDSLSKRLPDPGTIQLLLFPS